MGKIVDTVVRAFRKPTRQFDLEEYLADARQRGLTEDGEEAGLDEKGQVIADPVPLEPPVGYLKQPSMMENIRAMVRSEELRRAAESQGLETFEESEDFDIEDDPVDPSTPYENEFDPPLSELVNAGKAEEARKAANPPPDGPDAKKPATPEAEAPKT